MIKTKTRKFIAEKIRSQYVDEVSSKSNPYDNLVKLQKLDRDVKRKPIVVSIFAGIFGLIIFAFGLCLSLKVFKPMVIENFLTITQELLDFLFIPGIVMSSIGGFIMIFNYCFYRMMFKHRKRKARDEIFELSDKILGEVDFVEQITATGDSMAAEITLDLSIPHDFGGDEDEN